MLLMEDTPDDAELTMMSPQQAGLLNDFVVAEDGVDAIDYLSRADRNSPRWSSLM